MVASDGGRDPDRSAASTSDLLEAVLAATADCILVLDEAGIVREINPAAERDLGYRRGELLGRPLAETLVEPAHRAAFDAALWRLLQSSDGAAEPIEIEAVRRNGSTFSTELAITGIRRPAGWIPVARLRQIAGPRAGLPDSEATLKALMEDAPISVHIRDGEGRYVVANPHTAKLFKRPLHEIIGRLPSDLLPPEMAARATARLTEVMRAGEVMIDEEMPVDLDPVLWLRTIRVPLKNAAGEVVAVGTFDIDITERKLAEAELQRQREALFQREKLAALGSLLAGVAHELNNPLSVVLGRAMMLQEREIADPAVRKSAEALRTAAERCARIVRTFLAMARQRPQVRRAVPVEPQLDAALEILAYGLRTADIAIVRDFRAGADGIVDADEDALHQVFLNLLVNAQQALQECDPPRRLFVSTRTCDDRLELVVADNGPGVPNELRSRVFDPFFTTKTDGVGTGIGLSVCHGIVTSHGGSIAVDERPGGGARFTVRLQLATMHHAESETVYIEPAQSIAGRILVVDDEPEIVALLEDVLQQDGCTVTAAHDGAAALRAISKQRFDVVVTDLRMAGMDGRSLLGHLGSMSRATLPAVVVLTGDTLNLPSLMPLLGAAPVLLEKPVAPSVLRATIRRLLAGVGAGDG